MRFVALLHRLSEEDEEPSALAPICLPELGVFGVLRGSSGNTGSRAALDAAGDALALLPASVVDLDVAERLDRVAAALQAAVSAGADLALDVVIAVMEPGRAVIASVGTCSAHHLHDGRADRVTELDALPGGAQNGYYIVTKLLSRSSSEMRVTELALAAGESLALLSPRVTRALEQAPPTLSFLASSLSGHALFFSELASDLAESDACVVVVRPEARLAVES